MRVALLSLIGLALASSPSVCLSQEEANEGGLSIAAPEEEAFFIPPPRLGPVDSPESLIELEAFLEGFMSAYLEDGPVAGGVVSIVRDGRLLFARGYGYADEERALPVKADETLFRIGSVSKLFTFTSVMQQVEQGKLDLETDVNEYLEEVQVPNAFDEPITLVHLLTHTAGFEDRVIGLFATEESAMRPLEVLLSEQMPKRIRPPGEVSSYSNHGSALAMYLAARASSRPWLEVLETDVLEPLAMMQTSFRQPLPAGLQGQLSKGYSVSGDRLEEEGFEFVPLGSIGGASASATDMAKFMLAHLDGGAIPGNPQGGERLLSSESAAKMHSVLFRHAPGLNAMCHGFYEMSRNGVRVIGHGGDTLWFHSLLALVPEHDLGMFISFNTAGADPAVLYEAFMDHYFPLEDSGAHGGLAGANEMETASGPAPGMGTGQKIDRSTLDLVAGEYRSARHSHTTPAKLVAPLQTVRVETDSEDLALLIDGERYLPEADLRFRNKDGAVMAFRVDEKDAPQYAFLNTLPFMAFERTPARERVGLHLLVFLAALLLIALAVVMPPLGALLRWRYAGPAHSATEPPVERLPFMLRATQWLLAATLLVFVAGLIALVNSPESVVFGFTPVLRTWLLIPFLAALIAMAYIFLVLRAWIRGQGRFVPRIAVTVTLVGMLLFLWQLGTWRMFGAG